MSSDRQLLIAFLNLVSYSSRWLCFFQSVRAASLDLREIPPTKYVRSAILGCSFFAFARRDRTTNMSIASFRSKFVVLGVWLLEPYASRRRWPPGVCLHKCFSACHVTIEAPMCSDQLQGLGVCCKKCCVV